MLGKVDIYMEQHHMIEEGDRVLAGVSGGADSVAMLDILVEYQKMLAYDLMVLHVNHNLRGEEADKDAAYVEQLCRGYGIPFVCVSVDVQSLSKERHMSLEEAGRVARIQALDTYREKWNANKIALAHNSNDVAETMIHHLCRGSSLRGLCGITPVQGDRIRPLLCLERTEIEQYLKDRNLEHQEDESNASDDYTRNRIRHNILPVMVAAVNKNTVKHMSGTAEDLLEIQELLSAQAEQLVKQYVTFKRESANLEEGFWKMHPVLIREGLMQVIDRVCESRRDVTRGHLQEIMELPHKKVGSRQELPGKWHMVRTYSGVQLVTGPAEVPGTQEVVHSLCLGETCHLATEKLQTRVFSYHGEEIPEKRYTKWLNYDRIEGIVQIRHRQPGDYLVVNEAGQRKKLKDYFIDCKIPREDRDAIWLLAVGKEILWVIGYRINESYRITNKTREILEITYQGGNEDGRED